MGCNCKKQIDIINQKYGDGSHDKLKDNFLMKILIFFMKIIFGIICGGIIIVMVIPMLIYIILCLMFGKEATFRLNKLNKYLEKRSA